MERRASAAISQSLSAERPARLGLLELMARPQKEVRWLSLRCLGYVGYFHDLVAALNDSAHKLDWPDYIDELRVAVARDADTAAAVRADLENQYPQQAAALYRMLWGYTDEDLSSGEDANLVPGSTTTCWPSACWRSGTSRTLPAWRARYYRPEDTLAAGSSPKRTGKNGSGRAKSAYAAATKNSARRPAGAPPSLTARPPQSRARSKGLGSDRD